MSERMIHTDEAIASDINVSVSGPIGVGEGAIHTDITAERAQEIAEMLPRYLVEVDANAPGSCIDGRDCPECMDGQSGEPRYSVAGGDLVLGYAMAEMTGWFGGDAPESVEHKLTMVKDVVESSGIRIGAHVDAEAVSANFINQETGAGKTGCGADDKAPESAVMSVAIARQAATGDELATNLFKGFMNETFNAQKLASIQSQERVAHAYRGWDPRTSLQIVTNEDLHAVEKLAADETPTHGHAEALAVVVDIDGETVDQKALLRDAGVQVFVIDMPRIRQVARALATGPHAAEQYDELVHAGVAYHLGVYAVLCDGSQYFARLESAQIAQTA